jgi:diguanylate cyclase (GGDEF)-like protein
MVQLRDPTSHEGTTARNAGSAPMRSPAPMSGTFILAVVVAGLLTVATIAIGTLWVASDLLGYSSNRSEWRVQIANSVFLGGVITLLIAVTLLFLIRQFARLHRSAKQQLDTALGNITQGLMQYDSASRIVLFNRRYVEMYGLSLDVIKPGRLFRDVMKHRKQTGSFNGDPVQFCDTVLKNVSEKKLTHTILTTKSGRLYQIVNQPLDDGGWVTTHEDVTQLKQSEQRVEHLAHYDVLTGLPNRALFRDRLAQEIARTSFGAKFALLYIDIDEFKDINDSLGHPVGDEFLRQLAQRLKTCTRETDFIARLGGDEFAIIQMAIDGPADVEELVERLHSAIREPFQCGEHQLSSDASIGIAMAPADGDEIDQLIKHADLAMYEAKSFGRHAFRFFTPQMDAVAKARRELALDLREAIRTGGFEIHYQPVVDIRDNTITACEALLRWRHPKKGMISPADFIPIAEDTGMIAELGEWVLRTACAEAATWPHQVSLAVNVSPVQFKSQTLALKVVQALAASGLSAGRLELEITEAVLIRDDEAALAMLHQLRAIGVRIALDDFGTGYSSLSYLQRFPFDKIKIDRSFIKDLSGSGGSSSIVQAVVTIAAARNIVTTAEGVETQQQLDLLRTLGCTQMQGWLFSAAKPASEVRLMLGAGDEAPSQATVV